jgi:hypothetical protein
MKKPIDLDSQFKRDVEKNIELARKQREAGITGYTYESISTRDGLQRWSINDSNDDQIALCWHEEDAHYMVTLMNAGMKALKESK